jgi:hypothetical protein
LIECFVKLSIAQLTKLEERAAFSTFLDRFLTFAGEAGPKKREVTPL